MGKVGQNHHSIMGIDTDERQQNINVKKGPMFSKIISGDLLLKQWPIVYQLKGIEQ